jgi:hypothetical protein
MLSVIINSNKYKKENNKKLFQEFIDNCLVINDDNNLIKIRFPSPLCNSLFDIVLNASYEPVFSTIYCSDISNHFDNNSNNNILIRQGEFNLSMLNDILSTNSHEIEMTVLSDVSPTLLLLNSLFKKGWIPLNSDLLLESITKLMNFLCLYNVNIETDKTFIENFILFCTLTASLTYKLAENVVELIVSIKDDTINEEIIHFTLLITSGIIRKIRNKERNVFDKSISELSLLKNKSNNYCNVTELSASISSNKDGKISSKEVTQWRQNLSLDSKIQYKINGDIYDVDIVNVNAASGVVKFEYIDKSNENHIVKVSVNDTNLKLHGSIDDNDEDSEVNDSKNIIVLKKIKCKNNHKLTLCDHSSILEVNYNLTCQSLRCISRGSTQHLLNRICFGCKQCNFFICIPCYEKKIFDSTKFSKIPKDSYKKFRLNCHACQLRIRPETNTNLNEIGLYLHNETVIVFNESINGFYRLVNGRGFIMQNAPGLVYELVNDDGSINGSNRELIKSKYHYHVLNRGSSFQSGGFDQPAIYCPSRLPCSVCRNMQSSITYCCRECQFDICYICLQKETKSISDKLKSTEKKIEVTTDLTLNDIHENDDYIDEISHLFYGNLSMNIHNEDMIFLFEFINSIIRYEFYSNNSDQLLEEKEAIIYQLLQSFLLLISHNVKASIAKVDDDVLDNEIKQLFDNQNYNDDAKNDSIKTGRKVCCPRGHQLQSRGLSNNWSCDAADEASGCLSTNYLISEDRWRCEQCDFDYCGFCYESKVKSLDSFDNSEFQKWKCIWASGVNVRNDISLSSNIVKVIHCDDIIECYESNNTKDEGSHRIKLCDGSGWTSSHSDTGYKYFELISTSNVKTRKQSPTMTSNNNNNNNKMNNIFQFNKTKDINFAIPSFKVIISLILELAIKSSQASNKFLWNLSHEILQVISNSQLLVLTSYFCKSLVINAALSTSLIVSSELKLFHAKTFDFSINSMESIINLIRKVNDVEEKYKGIFSECIPLHLCKYMNSKITAAINNYSMDNICNYIFQESDKTILKIQFNSLKLLLRYLLNDDNDINNKNDNKIFKFFLIMFGQINNNDFIKTSIEKIWMDVILDCFTIEINKSTGPIAIEKLIVLFNRAKDISNCELKNILICEITTELSLIQLSQNLKQNQLLELSKSLAIYIDTIMDVSKSPYLTRKLFLLKYNLSITFVNLMINIDNNDFPHFYELLLARRLLRNRFISINDERNLLNHIPAMNNSRLMLYNYDFSIDYMMKFKLWQQNQLIYNQISLFNSTDDKDIEFNAIIISKAAWPLQKNVYPSLILPLILQNMQYEFNKFNNDDVYKNSEMKDDISTLSSCEFTTSNGINNNNNNNNNIFDNNNNNNFIWIDVTNQNNRMFGEVVPLANGSHIKFILPKGKSLHELSFEKHLKTMDNSPKEVKITTYSENGEIITCTNLELNKPNCWTKLFSEDMPSFKARTNKKLIAKIQVDIISIHSNHLNMNHYGSNSCCISRVKILVRDPPLKLKITKDNQISSNLTWCYGHGSVDMTATLNNEKTIHLQVNEPQVAVLMLVSKSNEYSTKELSQLTGLNMEQLDSVIKSLLQCNIVSKCKITSNVKISREFSSGDINIKFNDSNHPLYVSSINDNQNLLNIPTQQSIVVNKWKNEQIDSAIVRILKKNSNNCDISITIDVLLLKIKELSHLSIDLKYNDIFRRTESLIQSGIINKRKVKSGDFSILRSMEYSYFPLEEDISSTDNEVTNYVSIQSNSDNIELTSEDCPLIKLQSLQEINPLLELSKPSFDNSLLQRQSSAWGILSENEENEINDSVTFTENEISIICQDAIKKVMAITEEPYSVSVILLQYCKWDLNEVCTKFFDNSNKLRKDAGLNVKNSSNNCINTGSITDSKYIDCPICLETMSSDFMYSLHCSHYICIECWRNHIVHSMKENLPFLYCPQVLSVDTGHERCKCCVTLDLMDLVLPANDESLKQKWLLKSFVSANRCAFYCKNPSSCDGNYFILYLYYYICFF